MNENKELKKQLLTISEYQILCERTMQFDLNRQDKTIHSTNMLASEAGEVCSLFQKEL